MLFASGARRESEGARCKKKHPPLVVFFSAMFILRRIIRLIEFQNMPSLNENTIGFLKSDESAVVFLGILGRFLFFTSACLLLIFFFMKFYSGHCRRIVFKTFVYRCDPFGRVWVFEETQREKNFTGVGLGIAVKRGLFVIRFQIYDYILESRVHLFSFRLRDSARRRAGQLTRWCNFIVDG